MESRRRRNTPGGAHARRPLHFFFLCDASGSMSQNGKIQALNQAVRDAIPAMVKAAEGEPEVELLVRAIRFADRAEWHPSSDPIPVAQYTWADLRAGGRTAMGEALRLVADELRLPDLRGMAPVIVLVSDGQPTDDASGAIEELLGLPWGQKAVRIGIAIGHDANRDVLRAFIGDPERADTQLLEAENAEQLSVLLKWVSTTPVLEVSRPRSQPATLAGAAPGGLPPPPDLSGLADEVVF